MIGISVIVYYTWAKTIAISSNVDYGVRYLRSVSIMSADIS
jgi:hypothetical protein